MSILKHVLDSAERLGRNGITIEILLLKALAHKAQGNLETALDCLKNSLLLAEPEGYISLFIEEGPDMASLLQEAVRRAIKPEYCGRLLKAFSSLSSTPAPVSKTMGIVEPLSDRELEVLELIAKGLSNKDIASRLFIELRTVKWHTGNILSKLGVKNRTEAVARARDLKIIGK